MMAAASIRNRLIPCLVSLKQPKIYSPLFLNTFSTLKCFHTTTYKQSNLMQFFDNPKNFGVTEVKSGRSWTLDELRIKSNTDLHKLWFVLLKERNMLLTMEKNCKEACQLFPSPERLDKVQDSMMNLEEVVHERNDAYWRLEVGEEAPKPKKDKTLDPKDPLAVIRSAAEAVTQVKDSASVKFNYLIKEKERTLLRRQKRLHEREAMMLLKRFPHLDKEALQAKYPDIVIEKLLFNKKTRGSHEFNTA